MASIIICILKKPKMDETNKKYIWQSMNAEKNRVEKQQRNRKNSFLLEVQTIIPSPKDLEDKAWKLSTLIDIPLG